MNHPAYDSFWQDQALDKILAEQGLSVPTMLVHSLWDQEDIYGNIALYKSLKAHHPDQGQSVFGARAVVPSSRASRRRPHRRHQMGQRHRGLFSLVPAAALPRSLLEGRRTTACHRTGDCIRVRYRSMGRSARLAGGCASACSISREKLYLQPGGGLGFTAPAGTGFEAYVSDPAKPVPYLPRPIHTEGCRLNRAGKPGW